MKLIDKIYKTTTFLCALVLFGACDNDKWAEVELDSTPVYELTYLKNVETGKTGEVSKFSVYRELFDLIAWKNDYQTLRMNKIEFFAESSEAPSELPEWLKINSDTEKYLSFSFNEVYTEKEEVINPETGDKEEQEVTKKRMFMFEGKKENNSSGGYGHLTVTENDGTEVEYEVVLNDVLKPADF